MEQFTDSEKIVIDYCTKAIKDRFPDYDFSVEKREYSIFILLHIEASLFNNPEFLAFYGDLYKNYIVPNKYRCFIVREKKKE